MWEELQQEYEGRIVATRITYLAYDEGALRRDEAIERFHWTPVPEPKPRPVGPIRPRSDGLDHPAAVGALYTAVNNLAAGVEKHYHVLKAARLLGGFTATGCIVDHAPYKSAIIATAHTVMRVSEPEIERTYEDGFSHGFASPIVCKSCRR